MVWRRATYTILRVPEEVVLALGPTKRVEGEIAEHPLNLTLSRAPVVESVFLWIGQSLPDRIRVVPGEVVELRLAAAPDDRVDTPEDVAAALARAGLMAVCEGLAPGKRHRPLDQRSFLGNGRKHYGASSSWQRQDRAKVRHCFGHHGAGTPSEQQYSDPKLRSRTSSGTKRVDRLTGGVG